MGSASTPSAPNPAKTYLQGLQSNLEYAPVTASAEQNLRAEFDGPTVEANLDRQKQYGGGFLDLYKSSLAQTDPGNEALQKQLGGALSPDLLKSYSLSPDQTRNAEQTTRAAQFVRGNFLGNSAVAQEARAVGSASFTAHQQRITNAQNYLAVDNAVKQYTGEQKLVTGATSADRSEAYVGGTAGTDGQNTLDTYYNTAVQDAQYYQSLGPQAFLNPWQRMAQGAYIGLREGWQGGSFGGFVIGAFGAIGGALGGSFQGLINAPDYQWNVSLNQYNIYGTPASQIGASAGAAGASVALSAASSFG